MQLARSSCPVQKAPTGLWAEAYESHKDADYKGVPSDFPALSGEFDSVGEALGPRRIR
jgi:hypothetical protein